MRLSATRMRAMARKEWIQLRRDNLSMALGFLLPVILLIIFGFAIKWDVEDIHIAVLDRDRSAASRELVESFQSSGYFTVTHRLEADREIRARLVAGDVRAVLTIPPGFSANLSARRPAPVQLMVDGADANTATIAQSYAEAITSRFSASRLGMSIGTVQMESRVWYNPTLNSTIMIVPALIAVIMSVIAAMLTALTIAREWERGTMEQLASTPVHRLEVVLGKLIPYLGIGMVDVVIAVTAGITIFGAPLNGSVLLLAIMTLLFLLGALGFGIFISAAVPSQVLATQVALVTTYLPAIILSGFMFDIRAMPPFLQAVTYLIPARYFVTVTRGIFLKGVGLEVLWPEALAMVIFATVGLGLATRAFRKEVAR